MDYIVADTQDQLNSINALMNNLTDNTNKYTSTCTFAHKIR